MKRVAVLGVAFAFAGCLATSGSSSDESLTPASGETVSRAAAVAPDKQLATNVFETRVQYPATKGELERAVQQAPELSDGERKWIVDRLPKRFYKNLDEVLAELGMRHED